MARDLAVSSRRAFLRSSLAVAGAAVLVNACGSDGSSALRFANWQDYIDPELLEIYRRTTGRRVSYSTYASNDELADRLALAGVSRRRGRKPEQYDLIVPSDSLFRELLNQDRLAKLDTSIVTTALLGNLDMAVYTDPKWAAYGIPWATGMTGIGYDSDVFDEPPSWSVFADVAYEGKATLLDEMREAFSAAFFDLGEDPNTTDVATIEAATQRLTEFAAVVEFDSKTYLDRLQSGDIVVAQAFNTDVLQAKEKRPSLEFVVPESGGTLWTDLLAIPADAARERDANRFVAFMLDPTNAARNAEYLSVNTANVAAVATLPDEFTSDPAVFPDDVTRSHLARIVPASGAAATAFDSGWSSVTS